MTKKIVIIFYVVMASSVFSLDLKITAADIRIERAESGGIHLFIRKKDDISSVLLVETTKDPQGKADNYALRDTEYNAINGDEVRMLDGKPLVSEYSQYSIVDSSPQDDPVFGQAFHLYLPQVMFFGYPWTRSGEVRLEKGVFLNIRSYQKVFADYTGEYADNPFVLDIQTVLETREIPAPVPELLENFNQTTVETLSALARATTGKIAFSKNPDDLLGKIKDILSPPDSTKNLDLIFALDATVSMKDDIEKLRGELIPQALSILPEYKSYRIGLLLYKDYNDDLFYKGLPIKFFPFTADLNQFNTNLNSFRVSGGGDYPEAVYEAMYGCLEYFDWIPDSERRVILIGDAEPHPKPRGNKKYTRELVEELAAEKGVQIDTIILFDPDRRE